MGGHVRTVRAGSCENAVLGFNMTVRACARRAGSIRRGGFRWCEPLVLPRSGPSDTRSGGKLWIRAADAADGRSAVAAAWPARCRDSWACSKASSLEGHGGLAMISTPRRKRISRRRARPDATRRGCAPARRREVALNGSVYEGYGGACGDLARNPSRTSSEFVALWTPADAQGTVMRRPSEKAPKGLN